MLKNKWFYLFVFSIILIPKIYERLPIRIDITQQQSLNNSIWVSYSDLSIDTNYILFIPPKSKYIQNDKVQYLKRIGCKEGDYLNVVDNEFFCNGISIGKARKYDLNMNVVKQFYFDGLIPQDKYFVIGTHELSYDSKYFGFIDKSQILRKETPLFNEE